MEKLFNILSIFISMPKLNLHYKSVYNLDFYNILLVSQELNQYMFLLNY